MQLFFAKLQAFEFCIQTKFRTCFYQKSAFLKNKSSFRFVKKIMRLNFSSKFKKLTGEKPEIVY